MMKSRDLRIAHAILDSRVNGRIELTGDWEGRQTIAGEVEDETGGKSVWLTPGVRFNSAKGWSAAVGIGLPLWQDIGQAHPDNAYRMTLAIGRGF